jgi:hypothetical protein
MFVYDIVTCWDKKKACFRSQKCLFLGLLEAALAGNFFGFLGNVLPYSWEEYCLSPLGLD